MTDFTTTTWFPILTMVIGFGLSSISEWALHRRTARRERDARDAARRGQLFQQRNTFQRETLLELQDATAQLGRATGAIHHQDEMNFRKTKEWQKQSLPNELDEGFRLAQVRTSLLASRVRDEAVRKLVAEFRKRATATVMSADRDESNHSMQILVHMPDDLNERIGALLRTLDDDEAASPLLTDARQNKT